MTTDTAKKPANGLKPCPFCGNTEVEVAHLSESDIVADDWFVECDRPKGCGMSLYAIHRTRELAIAAWNRRDGGDHAND